ncbi:uncharacterized protein Z519_00670 [Cladophialophora bantiana CBS 173.52]|uniref:Uncharacterized protein n=1 Tax=Cladophialophora bantiana (strain ATCC 10958 / CBS 173.52 / CDC B-1940 / NIH 8579) TaxID=1442370 RepID=A0A0D2GKU7_CLAB1|nr:uncharacterized protein Z519_00670 [Cladophialophora bantiana CBS 173.52]KIW99007.1 hypothetical protein Z519_00670 [Cladophialophora bantiana CBS 173.52]
MAYQLLVLWLLWPYCAFANVEKIIFLAPPAENLPQDASIDNLFLTRLSEQYPSVRTHINASFPSPDSPKGTQNWFLIEDLRPERRYELRICWLATQPTSFWLYTHSLDYTFATPDLLASLSEYAYARRAQLGPDDTQALLLRKPKVGTANTGSTFLFLQVFAAADYFSLNQTLMEMVPPVAVDVILDPYIFNILPKSLASTGLYLLAVAVGAWFLSGWIVRLLASPVAKQGQGKLNKSD